MIALERETNNFIVIKEMLRVLLLLDIVDDDDRFEMTGQLIDLNTALKSIRW